MSKIARPAIVVANVNGGGSGGGGDGGGDLRFAPLALGRGSHSYDRTIVLACPDKDTLDEFVDAMLAVTAEQALIYNTYNRQQALEICGIADYDWAQGRPFTQELEVISDALYSVEAYPGERQLPYGVPENLFIILDGVYDYQNQPLWKIPVGWACVFISYAIEEDSNALDSAYVTNGQHEMISETVEPFFFKGISPSPPSASAEQGGYMLSFTMPEDRAYIIAYTLD